MIEISMEYTDLTHGFTFALLHTYTTYITYLCYFDGVHSSMRRTTSTWMVHSQQSRSVTSQTQKLRLWSGRGVTTSLGRQGDTSNQLKKNCTVFILSFSSRIDHTKHKSHSAAI